MTEKEGFLERIRREQSEARVAAGIRELQRRFAAGEFPENDDTIAAFSAGFFSAYTYQAEAREYREEGTNAHLLAFTSGLFGLILAGFYVWGQYLGVAFNDGAVAMPIAGAVLLIVAFCAARRSRHQAREAAQAHAGKWGERA